MGCSPCGQSYLMFFSGVLRFLNFCHSIHKFVNVVNVICCAKEGNKWKFRDVYNNDLNDVV